VLAQIAKGMGAVVLAGAVLSGCGSHPTVSKDSLQNDISDRLTKAGQQPRSVTCKDDLIGEVGRSARCEIVLSPQNTFESVVTVTGVAGSVVNYDMNRRCPKNSCRHRFPGWSRSPRVSPSTRSNAIPGWKVTAAPKRSAGSTRVASQDHLRFCAEGLTHDAAAGQHPHG
jgi:hypothetical protein